MTSKCWAACLTTLVLIGCAGKGSPTSSPGVDAGSPDAGSAPPDAGSPDAGVDAGAACPYAFCEDFESFDAGVITNGALLGPWKASFAGQQATMQVTASGGFGDSKALRVTFDYVPDGGSLRATLNQHTDAGALVGPTLYGRAEIYYASVGDGGLPLAVHSWFFNVAGRTPDGGATSMNLGGGGAKLQLNYQYPPGPKYPDAGPERKPDGGVLYPGEDSAQGGLLTTDAWHCVQWEYAGDPDNLGKVWLDGTQVLDVNGPALPKNWVLSDAYSSFDLGFTHYQTLHNGIDFYLDDFALDSAMVPCP